jgi:hypothetical protein
MSVSFELRRFGRALGITAIFTIVGPLVISAIVGIIMSLLGLPILYLLLSLMELEVLQPWLHIALVLLFFLAFIATIVPAFAAGVAFALFAVYAEMNTLWTALGIIVALVIGVVILGFFGAPSDQAGPLLLPSVQGVRQAAWLALFMIVPSAIAAAVCWLVSRPLHRMS